MLPWGDSIEMDIKSITKISKQGFSIDEIIRVDEIKEIDQTIREVSPMHITGRGDIDSTKVTFHLKIEGHLILPCSRTLVDVKLPINVETTETFLLQGSEYATEEEAYQVKGDVIDLMPIIREILLLEVPMQVFCEDVNLKKPLRNPVRIGKLFMKRINPKRLIQD